MNKLQVKPGPRVSVSLYSQELQSLRKRLHELIAGRKFFIILVTGDRNWPWSARFIIGKALQDVTRTLAPDVFIVLIEGGAKGADYCAKTYAEKCGWGVLEVEAHWDLYGNRAGPVRNRQMFELGQNVILAFHDDLSKSRGTKSMVGICTESGSQVTLYGTDGKASTLGSE